MEDIGISIGDMIEYTHMRDEKTLYGYVTSIDDEKQTFNVKIINLGEKAAKHGTIYQMNYENKDKTWKKVS